MNDLIAMTFAILLPLVPAYILYKTLPAPAGVSGPFRGLTIQLSGAFAGYFLLTLLTFGFVSSRSEETLKSQEVWQVTGKINCEQTDGLVDPKQLSMTMLPANTMVTEGAFYVYVPPNIMWGKAGTFYVNVMVARMPSGHLDFPTLQITHPNHQTVDIDLAKDVITFGQNVKKLVRDDKTKIISVGDIISLAKIEVPYQPTGPAPLQVSGSELEVAR